VSDAFGVQVLEGAGDLLDKSAHILFGNRASTSDKC